MRSAAVVLRSRATTVKSRAPDTPETTTFGRLVGVNLIYSTPLPGLKLGYSGYRSELDETDLNLATVGDDTKAVNVVSVDYVSGPWDAKVEYGTLSFADQRGKTGYVQLARTFTQRWTPFVRYDRIECLVACRSTSQSRPRHCLFRVSRQQPRRYARSCRCAERCT